MMRDPPPLRPHACGRDIFEQHRLCWPTARGFMGTRGRVRTSGTAAPAPVTPPGMRDTAAARAADAEERRPPACPQLNGAAHQLLARAAAYHPSAGDALGRSHASDAGQRDGLGAAAQGAVSGHAGRQCDRDARRRREA